MNSKTKSLYDMDRIAKNIERSFAHCLYDDLINAKFLKEFALSILAEINALILVADNIKTEYFPDGVRGGLEIQNRSYTHWRATFVSDSREHKLTGVGESEAEAIDDLLAQA